jgi:hypothetical protein
MDSRRQKQEYSELPQLEAKINEDPVLRWGKSEPDRLPPTGSSFSCVKRLGLACFCLLGLAGLVAHVTTLVEDGGPDSGVVGDAALEIAAPDPTLTVDTTTLNQTLTVAPSPAPAKGIFGVLRNFSRFSHANGHYEDWLLAKRRAKWTSYPLSDDDLNLTYIPRERSNCGFRNLVAKLESGQSAKLVVYGDSVSWGASCDSPTWGLETTCAWPVRVQAWLSYQFPHWNLTVVNRAQRSWGPGNFVDSSMDIDDADAYIIGFVLGSRRGTRRLLQSLSGPKLLLGLGRTCNTRYHDCLVHCKGNASRVVSVSTNGRKRLPAEGSDDVKGPHYLCEEWWYLQEEEDAAAQELGVSLASYRNVYWRDREHPVSDVAFFMNGMAHPDTVGQDFVSHVVEYALWREFRSEGAPCTITRETDRGCAARPLSVMDVKDDSRSIQPITAIGWRKFEDRPTKPGWIAESFTPDSVLEFQVVVKEVLIVTFLASYENVYPALMKVEGCPEAYQLQPLWSVRASMPKTLKFSGQGSQAEHIQLSCLPTNSSSTPVELRVSFRALTGKFKLLGIMTC